MRLLITGCNIMVNTITVTPLRDAKQEAFKAMDVACRGNVRARAIAGELVSNAFFMRKDFAVAVEVLRLANKYGAAWFCRHVHGVEVGDLVETGVIAYCLYMAYDVIVEVQSGTNTARGG